VPIPSRWIALAAGQVALPWRQNPLQISATLTPRPAALPRNGLLLLFGAVALAVLALASGSLLRLLRRMDEVARAR
jgi:hypothetical protein